MAAYGVFFGAVILQYQSCFSWFCYTFAFLLLMEVYNKPYFRKGCGIIL